MNTAIVSAAAPHPTPLLDRAALLLLFVFVGTLQVSIFAAQILLAVVLLCWVARLARDRTRPAVPPFFTALIAYSGLTLLSAAFSLDPLASLVDSKQLVLFAIVPLVYDLARGRKTAAMIIDVVVTVGAASAVIGIVQYGMLHYDHLGKRPQGAMHHYFTYSGILMLATSVAVARLVFGARDRIWPALVMPALVVALSLTLGRSAWVGACAAVALLLALKDYRLTAVVPIVVAVVFALAPETVTRRMLSVFDLQDPTNRDRIAMIQTGAAMVAAHPLTGVGPNMVPRVYVQYRAPGAVEQVNPHLHNVPMQVAAERGIPALAVWLWFVIALSRALLREFRQSSERVIPATGIAALAAMLAAGLFEYNFGDSEFLMLFLVLITLPFAASRTDAASSAGA